MNGIRRLTVSLMHDYHYNIALNKDLLDENSGYLNYINTTLLHHVIQRNELSYAATFQVLPPSSLPSASCLILTQSIVSDPTFVFSELESADGRLSADR